MRATLTVLAAVALLACSLACSSGSRGPEPGTPAFFWSAAKTNFAQGDHLKVSENLDRVMKSADLRPQAIPWSLIVSSGLARGYMELADAYEEGAKAAKTNSSYFRTQMIDNRRYARNAALQFAQTFRVFEIENKDEQIKLVFPFPPGTAAEPPMLAKIRGGMIPDEAARATITRAMIERGVVLETSRAVGAGQDATKAQAMFKSGEVTVPRTSFLLGMAGALYDQALLFGPKKLDDPTKLQLFAEEALDALKPVPGGKDVKGLNDKIQKSLKEAKSRIT
jgi:hypothetical protein